MRFSFSKLYLLLFAALALATGAPAQTTRSTPPVLQSIDLPAANAKTIVVGTVAEYSKALFS